jgi:hypothetical protein
MSSHDAVLAMLIFTAALLYSSVGHGGASAYLAAMALMGTDPTVMKPTALVLNILVASIATVKFVRARCFAAEVFWPFALASVPLAYIGGGITLPTELYRKVVGLVLVFAALRLFVTAAEQHRVSGAPPLPVALLVGAAIGFLSGLTGVGGGIFLSPLLLLFAWSGTREASGVAAAFILVNSAAGLMGHSLAAARWPAALPVWAAAAICGGWIGSSYGSRSLPLPALRRVLACILLVGAAKMIAS